MLINKHINVVLVGKTALPFLIAAFIVSATNAYGQQQMKDSTTSKVDNLSCFQTFMKYSSIWKLDSVGKTGARLIIAELILDACPFPGIKWEGVSKFFGKPNKTFVNKEYTLYRFWLNYSPKPFPGSLYFEFTVKDGVITKTLIREVDG